MVNALVCLGFSGRSRCSVRSVRSLAGRRFGRHQERLAVAGLQRQRRGDVSHRDVVLAFVVLDQLAEQLSSRTAERVGDGIGEFRYPLRVDVLDGGQFGLGKCLPRCLFDRLEQVALPRGDEQQRGARTSGPAGASDPVYVGLGVVRDVVVEHMRYPLHVQPARRHIGGDQDVDAAFSQRG